MDINVMCETRTLIEDKIGKYLNNLGFQFNFLDTHQMHDP
jgi:hypothetical protein